MTRMMSVMMVMLVLFFLFQFHFQLLKILLIPLLSKLLRLHRLPPSLRVELRFRLQSVSTMNRHIFVSVGKMIRLVEVLAEQLLERTLLRTVFRLLLLLLLLPLNYLPIIYSAMLAFVNPTNDRRTLRK